MANPQCPIFVDFSLGVATIKKCFVIAVLRKEILVCGFGE
jgi:hypothetical protein